jgi:GNAT superfamily N-acetyltransferase
MNEGFNIAYVDKPEESAWGIIRQGIRRYNEQQASNDKFQRLCFALYTPDQEIVGGVIGEAYWEWFHLDLLWVKEELRGRGFGHRLLKHAEDEAKDRGARHVYLDTFSFQAPEFYRQHGYQVYRELIDIPPGFQRYFLKKQL